MPVHVAELTRARSNVHYIFRVLLVPSRPFDVPTGSLCFSSFSRVKYGTYLLCVFGRRRFPGPPLHLLCFSPFLSDSESAVRNRQARLSTGGTRVGLLVLGCCWNIPREVGCFSGKPLWTSICFRPTHDLVASLACRQWPVGHGTMLLALPSGFVVSSASRLPCGFTPARPPIPSPPQKWSRGNWGEVLACAVYFSTRQAGMLCFIGSYKICGSELPGANNLRSFSCLPWST